MTDRRFASLPALAAGDLLPAMGTPPPGPRSRDLARRLAAAEAPGVNTLYRGEPSILWQEALGANVLDADGNRYLDLTSGFGVAAVGHRHPQVVAAIHQQADRLLHALGDVHGHPLRVELAERLAALVPVGDVGEAVGIYPAVSGSDAVEIAVKTALLVTGRSAVVAFAPSYHGLTTGALALTSRPAFRQPFAAHLHPHLRRLPYGSGGDELERALAGDGAAGDTDAEGSGPAGCVVVEPVVGREGVIFPPPGWLAALAAACRRHGALLIADEVFTGFGRTGRWFACQHPAVAGDGGGAEDAAAAGAEAEDDAGIRPDLLVCGKALGGGLPIAAVVGSRRLLDAWESDGEARHTATFIANPLACAAALAVLDALHDEALPQRSAALETRVGDRLAGWPARFPQVVEVRGRGLLWGIELDDRGAAGRLVAAALARGLLLLAGGAEGRVAQVVPPLTITEAQLDSALDLLEGALAESA